MDNFDANKVKHYVNICGKLVPTPTDARGDWIASKDFDTLREEFVIIKDECIDHVNLYKAWTQQRVQIEKELKDLKVCATNVLQEALSNVTVHPCDEHSEEIKVKELPLCYQKLYKLLTNG